MLATIMAKVPDKTAVQAANKQIFEMVTKLDQQEKEFTAEHQKNTARIAELEAQLSDQVQLKDNVSWLRASLAAKDDRIRELEDTLRNITGLVSKCNIASELDRPVSATANIDARRTPIPVSHSPVNMVQAEHSRFSTSSPGNYSIGTDAEDDEDTFL